MRALSVRAPRQASVVWAADPSPSTGEVVIGVRACGVCASDLNAWRGVAGVEYPLADGAPGHEAWGQVAELGPQADGLRVGDIVTGLVWNACAEFAVARAENLLVVPRGFEDTLLLGEPLACAMNVVRRAELSATKRFAIVGFGYLAALVVELAPAPPAGWIAISRRPESRDLARRLGADAAYDFSDVPADCWDSFPVVIEAAGAQHTLDIATWLTAERGRLVIAGYHADGPRTINMQSWNWKGLDVINAHERQPSVYVQALREAMAQLGPRCADLAGLVTHRWRMEDTSNAFDTVEARPAGFVKGVICP